MTQPEVKFANDKYFQETVVQAIIVDNGFAEQMLEVLNIEYFSFEHLKSITKIMFDYFGKYKTFPSFKLLVTIVKDEISDDALKEQIIGYLLRIKKDVSVSDIEYVKESSLDFCKKRSLALALEASLTLMEQKKYEQIEKEIKKALMAGSEKNLGHDLQEDFEKRMLPESYFPIPTPWEEVNKKIKGGLGGGKLGCIAALTKVGKSHALVDLGAHAVMNGFNVVHYTLELSEIDIGQRYDSRISGIPIDDLFKHKDFVKKQESELMKGKLIIKSFPMKRVTLQAIKNHYNNLLSRDIKVDMIIVDYLDLVKSTENYDSKRLNEESVFEETRGWITEVNKPLWTVTQINREGFGVEVLTSKNISECFAKAMIVDLFVTINRKKDSPTPEIGNMFIDLSRLGPDGIKFPMMINTAISKIKILEPDYNSFNEEGEDPMEKLRAQYKDFKKKESAKTKADEPIN
jgi:replicative DNA helicase